jgi:hypothetical protein
MNGHALSVVIQSGVPGIAWGKPGTGKTSWVKEFAEETGAHLESVIASIREPSDFAGLPVITDDGSVRMAAPQWAINLKDAVERGQPAILFLDELSTAPPAVQSALLRVVFERVVGELELPEEVRIIAASNPTGTSSGTWTLSAALANRFVHLDWDIEPKTWVEGMTNGWEMENDMHILPEDWMDGFEQNVSLISSFIQHRPALLLNEPDNTEESGGAWPSPRSWENAAKILTAARSVDMNKTQTLQLLIGCVGKGAATEFLTWEQNLDLQDPEMLLKTPNKFEVPDRGDKVFAVLSAVVTAARGDLTEERWLNAWQVLGKAAKKGKADVAAIPARNLVKARTDDLPIPQDVKEFLPVLNAAGLVG